MNIYTVIASIYWGQYVPREGKFDYFLLDNIIREAATEDLKLVAAAERA